MYSWISRKKRGKLWHGPAQKYLLQNPRYFIFTPYNGVAAAAQLNGISVTKVYRALRLVLRPRTGHRSDHDQPQILPPSELEHYCELIAALKLRTTNKAGRHLSTGRNTVAGRA